jgi:hypothetical protein
MYFSAGYMDGGPSRIAPQNQPLEKKKRKKDMWHFGEAGRPEKAPIAAASAGHLFNDRSGWTLRVGTDGRFSVSFLLIIPDNEQTVLPAPRTLIRYARSAHFHRRKKTENVFSPFFGYFFFIYSPHRFKYE